MINMLGATIFQTSGLGDYKYLEGIVNFLDIIVVPLTIILAAGAAIMSIIIGVAIAKAESSDKAQEMKKRLIGLVITCIVVTVLVWVLGYVLANFGTIMDFIKTAFTKGVEKMPGGAAPEGGQDPGAAPEGGGVIKTAFLVARLCRF